MRPRYGRLNWRSDLALHIDSTMSHLSRTRTVGEWLESLRVAYGSLTAEVVVREARSRKSPGHGLFEWDDATAGEAWRLEQARRVMRALEVTVEQRESPIRKFVVVREENGDDTYQDLVVAMRDDRMREQVLARALSELRAFRRKYAELKELADVFTVIDKLET